MTRSLLALSLVLTLATLGCSGTADPATTAGSNNPSPTTPQVAVNPGTVVAQPGMNPASGVDLQNVGPEVVVDQFLRALQQGNRELVSSLLTNAARIETAKFGLEVQPESIPDSTFRIVKAAYLPEQDPTATPQVAHVASLWAEDGGEEAYEIIWVLRHEPVGWRIAAMGLTIDFSKDPLLLDFEHPEEMMRVREQAMQDLAQQEANPAEQNTEANPQAPPSQGDTNPSNLPAGNISQFPGNPGEIAPSVGNPGSSLRQPGAERTAQPPGINNPIRR